jgi:ATP-dependent protease ClpP protease subunit
MADETCKVKRNLPSKPLASIHEFYLTDEIGPPEEYLEWFDTIRHAGENDIIKIYINSYGGDVMSAIQFMRVFHDTSATIICSVEGGCMSAATMIFLAASHYEITPHSIFLFHNYAGGVQGKGGEMIDQIQHERQWSEKLMQDVYKDFMTKEEIQAMLENKDIWLNSEEVAKRLEARIAKRAKENETKEKTVKKSPKKILKKSVQ